MNGHLVNKLLLALLVLTAIGCTNKENWDPATSPQQQAQFTPGYYTGTFKQVRIWNAAGEQLSEELAGPIAFTFWTDSSYSYFGWSQSTPSHPSTSDSTRTDKGTLKQFPNLFFMHDISFQGGFMLSPSFFLKGPFQSTFDGSTLHLSQQDSTGSTIDIRIVKN